MKLNLDHLDSGQRDLSNNKIEHLSNKMEWRFDKMEWKFDKIQQD